MALVRSRERAGRLTQREQHLWDLLQVTLPRAFVTLSRAFVTARAALHGEIKPKSAMKSKPFVPKQACCEGPQGAETEGMLEALAALKTDPRLAHLVLDVLQVTLLACPRHVIVFVVVTSQFLSWSRPREACPAGQTSCSSRWA
eukprot:2491013-Rhodomonas_salina.1